MVLPTVNRELRFNGLGGDLEVLEKEVPVLPANEILVKVHAASINPCDIQLWWSGLVAVVAGDKGMGRDFSGTVVAVGSGVKGWAEGDDIFGLLFHIVCALISLIVWLFIDSCSLVKGLSASI
jgi:NADPH:quinone reductase-like Zn-dependent oxidoreductase